MSLPTLSHSSPHPKRQLPTSSSSTSNSAPDAKRARISFSSQSTMDTSTSSSSTAETTSLFASHSSSELSTNTTTSSSSSAESEQISPSELFYYRSTSGIAVDTALFFAIDSEDIEGVKTALKAGASLSATTVNHNLSPLGLASRKSNTDIVEYIILADHMNVAKNSHLDNLKEALDGAITYDFKENFEIIIEHMTIEQLKEVSPIFANIPVTSHHLVKKYMSVVNNKINLIKNTQTLVNLVNEECLALQEEILDELNIPDTLIDIISSYDTSAEDEIKTAFQALNYILSNKKLSLPLKRKLLRHASLDESFENLIDEEKWKTI